MVNWKKVTPDEMYKFISRNDSVKHDIKIDRITKKYTKKQLVDELAEFGLTIPAKHIINMFSRKKYSSINDVNNKRMLAFASYYLNLYRVRHRK